VPIKVLKTRIKELNEPRLDDVTRDVTDHVTQSSGLSHIRSFQTDEEIIRLEISVKNL
jgi:hypothetical protein